MSMAEIFMVHTSFSLGPLNRATKENDGTPILRRPTAENDSPLTPIYNTQVKTKTSDCQVWQSVLTWVLRGLCAPGLGQFTSHFPCGSLVGALRLRGSLAPRFGARSAPLAGPMLAFSWGHYGPQEKPSLIEPSRLVRGFITGACSVCASVLFRCCAAL